MVALLLKRAYVRADGEIVGRIFEANAPPVGSRGRGRLSARTMKAARDRTATRQRQAAFAKSWRRD